jgi:RHS repeat-associated protein
LQSESEYDGYGIYNSIVGNPTTASGYVGSKSYVTDPESGLLELGKRYYLPILGRFLTQDSIGQKDTFNLYEYCHDNPVTASDPSGEYAEVTQSGNNISITIPIFFMLQPGVNGVDEANAVFSIEKAWTGEFGKYNVKTVVQVLSQQQDATAKGDVNEIELYQDNHNVNIPSQCDDHDINGLDGGTWYMESQWPWLTAHEAGHLCGLTDEYNASKDADGNRITMAKDGWEGNIMAESHGVVDERNIQGIIDASKMPAYSSTDKTDR